MDGMEFDTRSMAALGERAATQDAESARRGNAQCPVQLRNLRL